MTIAEDSYTVTECYGDGKEWIEFRGVKANQPDTITETNLLKVCQYVCTYQDGCVAINIDVSFVNTLIIKVAAKFNFAAYFLYKCFPINLYSFVFLLYICKDHG